jgi:hypothetical protein
MSTNAINATVLENKLLREAPMIFLLFDICRMIMIRNGVVTPYINVVSNKAYTALICSQCIPIPKHMAIAMIT